MTEYTPRNDPMYPGEMTDENIRAIFGEAGDLNVRKLLGGGYELTAYAIDGLTSGADISEYVFTPIVQAPMAQSMQELYDEALLGMVYNAVAKPCKNLDDVALLLVNGFCVVLFPGVGAIAFEVKTGEKRGIGPPDVENTYKGPKDAFVETVRTNTSLVRRHLRSPDLRIYETKIGRRSLTNVSVLWIDGITDPVLVKRMKDRLDSIDIDGFITPSSVEEYVTGSRMTAFPLLQYTERTDRFCHGLLDGRVGVIVDGMPVGYLAPVDIGYLMDSPEDIGRDFVSASCIRVLRYAALFLSLLLPAIYIAFTMFHMNWLPENLRNVILSSKENVPFNAAWEVLGLLVAFELLQESGIHLPHSIGQSVSIIGGIVVGTAGVEAGLVSPVALIMVSIAGVCGFVLPNRDLATAVRVWRFAFAVLAVILGMVGVGGGVLFLAIHLCSLRSLGVPYVILFEPGLLRRRLKTYKRRDHHMNTVDKRKQK